MRRGLLLIAIVLVVLGMGSAVAFGLPDVPSINIDVSDNATTEQYG